MMNELPISIPMPNPEISLDETTLPEIKNWEVGGVYTIILEVEQLSVSKDQMDNEDELRATFSVLSAKAIQEETPMPTNLKEPMRKLANKIKSTETKPGFVRKYPNFRQMNLESNG